MEPCRSNGEPRIVLRAVCFACLLQLSGCDSFSGPTGHQQMEQQKERFLELVTSAGGSAELTIFAMPGMRGVQQQGWEVSLSEAEISDELIEAITEIADQNLVLSLDVSNSNIGDEQLVQLDEKMVLRGTAILNLKNTAITDAGVDQLDHTHALTELNLTGTKISDEAVERLRKRQASSKDTPIPFRRGPKVTRENKD